LKFGDGSLVYARVHFLYPRFDARVDRLKEVRRLQADAELAKHTKAVQCERLLQALLKAGQRGRIEQPKLLADLLQRPRRRVVRRVLVGGLELLPNHRPVLLREVAHHVLPLVPLAALQDQQGQPLTQKVVQVMMRRVARRANVKPGVHILRHTFCSHLAMRGAPARAIQELAGHQDLDTTQRYMHLSPAALDAAIRLLDGPAEAGPHDRSSRGEILEAAGNRP